VERLKYTSDHRFDQEDEGPAQLWHTADIRAGWGQSGIPDTDFEALVIALHRFDEATCMLSLMMVWFYAIPSPQ
jgi:hypothetical protein